MSLKVKIFKNSSFKDHRGFYWTTWKKGIFSKKKFNHDKFSVSKKNVLRGFHCDFKSWKLVTCVFGKVFFVVADMEKKSKNYLKYKSWILSHKKPTLILIPPHFANAYLCLSKYCSFHYKWSYSGKYPDVKDQKSFRWDDPKLKVRWPIKKPILSKRDKNSKYIK